MNTTQIHKHLKECFAVIERLDSHIFAIESYKDDFEIIERFVNGELEPLKMFAKGYEAYMCSNTPQFEKDELLRSVTSELDEFDMFSVSMNDNYKVTRKVELSDSYYTHLDLHPEDIEDGILRRQIYYLAHIVEVITQTINKYNIFIDKKASDYTPQEIEVIHEKLVEGKFIVSNIEGFTALCNEKEIAGGSYIQWIKQGKTRNGVSGASLITLIHLLFNCDIAVNSEGRKQIKRVAKQYFNLDIKASWYDNMNGSSCKELKSIIEKVNKA